MTNKKPLSIFGATGFIGSEFTSTTTLFTPIVIDRNDRTTQSEELLYLISTTDNYNVLSDIFIDVNTNIKILLETLEASKGKISTFNFISSWFVYGDGPLPATESTHCNPKGFYSITKLAAEQLLISYCKTFGINYRILRLCNVFGGHDKGSSKKKNALQFLINEIKNHRAINLYHNGQFYRDYMHVSDVAMAIETVISKGELNTIYNIGTGNKVLFKDLVDYAVTLCDSKSEIIEVEPTDFHKTVQVKDFFMDTTKLKTLGFSPKTSLYDGIKELCL